MRWAVPMQAMLARTNHGWPVRAAVTSAGPVRVGMMTILATEPMDVRIGTGGAQFTGNERSLPWLVTEYLCQRAADELLESANILGSPPDLVPDARRRTHRWCENCSIRDYEWRASGRRHARSRRPSR